MATEILSVELRADGSRVIKRNIEDVVKSSDAAHNSVLNLKNALLALFGGVVVREMTEMVNTYTKIQNRLRVVTKGTEELAAATDDLFAIAQRTRNSFESTAELYVRLSLATRQLGLEQAQALKFTERLNKAIVVSGATSQEAQNALIQFSQGLSKGVLNGDELRSVLEQLPIVADVIARQMGVTRGALRLMGEQGLITADVILEAFENSADEIEASFARTIVTLPQAFVYLRNSAIKNLGEIDKALGVSQALAGWMKDLADNLPNLIRLFSEYQVIILSVTAATVGLNAALATTRLLIQGLIAPLGRFLILLAANPITLFITAIVGAVTALYQMRNELKVTNGGLATLADFAVVSFSRIRAAIDVGIDYFVQFANFIDQQFGGFFREVFRSLSNVTFADFIRSAAFLVDEVINLFIGLGEGIGVALAGVKLILPTIFRESLRDTMDVIEIGINSVKMAFLDMTGDTDQFVEFKFDFDAGSPALLSAEQVGRDVMMALKSGMGGTRAQDLLSDVLLEAEEVARKRLAAPKITPRGGDAGEDSGQENNMLGPRELELQKINREIEAQSRFLGLTNQQREVENKLFQMQEGLLTKGVRLKTEEIELYRQRFQFQQVLVAEGQLLDDTVGRQEDLNLALQAYNNLLAKSPELANQLRASLLAANADILGGGSSMVDIAVAQYETTMQRIAMLRDANVISEQQAAQAIAAAQVTLNETRLNSFSEYFGTLAGLSKIQNKKLANIGKAAAITQATIDGYLAVQKALASAPPPWNIALAAGVGAITAGNVAAIMSQDLPGFARGGSMMVGGSGGTDSQVVAFRATPNERVTVETPSQQRGNGATEVTINVYAEDPGAEGRIRTMLENEFVPQVIAATEGRIQASMKRKNLA